MSQPAAKRRRRDSHGSATAVSSTAVSTPAAPTTPTIEASSTAVSTAAERTTTVRSSILPFAQASNALQQAAAALRNEEAKWAVFDAQEEIIKRQRRVLRYCQASIRCETQYYSHTAGTVDDKDTDPETLDPETLTARTRENVEGLEETIRDLEQCRIQMAAFARTLDNPEDATFVAGETAKVERLIEQSQMLRQRELELDFFRMRESLERAQTLIGDLDQDVKDRLLAEACARSYATSNALSAEHAKWKQGKTKSRTEKDLGSKEGLRSVEASSSKGEVPP